MGAISDFGGLAGSGVNFGIGQSALINELYGGIDNVLEVLGPVFGDDIAKSLVNDKEFFQALVDASNNLDNSGVSVGQAAVGHEVTNFQNQNLSGIKAGLEENALGV